MTSVVIILRRTRTLLWTALSILIIAAAVMVGLGKLLLPYSAEFKPRVEAWLSGEFGRRVEIESFSGEWRAFGPQLAIKGLRLPAVDGSDDTAVIEEAVIDIKPFNVLIPSRALYDFRVVGADFRLVHLPDGRFEFSGLGVGGGGQTSGSALKQLATISAVILEDSNLRYDDEIHDIHLDLRAINGRLRARGDLLWAEIAFRLAHGDVGQVSGELEATARLQMDSDQHPTSASWQLSVQELMLGQLRDRLPRNDFFPSRGRLNAEIWGDWDREEKHRVRGAVDLRDANVASELMDRSIARVNTRFRWQLRSTEIWRLDLADLTYEDEAGDWSVKTLALGRNLGIGVGLWASADAIAVAKPVAIARDVMRVVGKDWPRYLPMRGEGVVRDFELVLNKKMRLGRASGHFRGGNVGDWGKWPDISNVDGILKFGPGRGQLDISGSDVVVEWPRMFEAPLTIDLPSCLVSFAWSGEKGKYQVGLNECAIENDFVSARGEMRFKGDPPGKPAVDVMVVADHLEAGAVGDYWPRALIKERAVDWLENGLVGGQLVAGRLQIHGDMDDWPFDGGEGRFEAVAELNGAEIDYFDGWPRAKAVDGTAHFVNSGMDLMATSQDIGGATVNRVRAQIADFREPQLEVDYETVDDLTDLLGFIRQTPLTERIGTDLSRFVFEGAAKTSGSFSVPLRQGGDGVLLDGLLELDENSFNAPDVGFALNEIKGLVTYDEAGFAGQGLAARYAGKPATLAIEAGRAAPADQLADGDGTSTGAEGEGYFVARLNGDFEVAEVLPAQLLDTWPPLGDISGSSQWQARLDAGANREARLTVNSTLEGIEIPLPAPLDKTPAAAWPIQFSVPLAGASRLLEISLADRFSMKMSLGEDWTTPQGAMILIGTGQTEPPTEGQLRLSGATHSLDLDGWIRLVIDQALAGKSLGGLQLDAGELVARDLIFLDRTFENVAMQLSTADAALGVTFDAESIDGRVSFVGLEGGSQSISAELERLVLGPPLSSGMELDVDPSQLPTLHLYVNSFRYSGVELGQTRIEAYPTPQGFHFEKVEAESEQMSVRANGDWALIDGVHRSNFEIHMTSESLGDFLRHLNFASPVEGGQTLVDFSVWWEGSPGQFRLARLNGEVNFNVNTGVIRDASPGTGRLLGLLSVQSLPRRLALDFRDVFDSGLVFDEANGSFTMLNGSARTDDVTLTSSAANISFSGTTDLVERQYDQLITVRPGLGNTLPVIGAIAGGPGGAAAGLALQGLLHDELGEASQVQYTLTGDWDSPRIEPVLKSRSDG